VEVIITGSILNLRKSIDINARIISVQSGSIIAVEDITADTDNDYHNLVKQLTAKIMRILPKRRHWLPLLRRP
jgi:TolB-like protein